MTKAVEFFTMDGDELESRLVEARRELLNLRFQLATGQLDNVSQLKSVRRDVARILTVLREMEIAESEGVAFEAPAADVLLTAHRELEKLVLTARQARIKDSVAQAYGDMVHEGQHLDPVCRDIEALLESSQARVTGSVKILLRAGSLFIEGVNSPYSLMAASKGVYGESAGEWTPADALGYSKMLALPGILHQRAGAQKP